MNLQFFDICSIIPLSESIAAGLRRSNSSPMITFFWPVIETEVAKSKSLFRMISIEFSRLMLIYMADKSITSASTKATVVLPQPGGPENSILGRFPDSLMELNWFRNPSGSTILSRSVGRYFNSQMKSSYCLPTRLLLILFSP